MKDAATSPIVRKAQRKREEGVENFENDNIDAAGYIKKSTLGEDGGCVAWKVEAGAKRGKSLGGSDTFVS